MIKRASVSVLAAGLVLSLFVDESDVVLLRPLAQPQPKCNFDYWPDHSVVDLDFNGDEGWTDHFILPANTSIGCEIECSKIPQCAAFLYIGSGILYIGSECVGVTRRVMRMMDSYDELGPGAYSAVKRDCDGSQVVLGPRTASVAYSTCPEDSFASQCECINLDGGTCKAKMTFATSESGRAYCLATSAAGDDVQSIITCLDRCDSTEYTLAEYEIVINDTTPDDQLRPAVSCPDHFVAPKIVGCSVHSDEPRTVEPKPIIDHVAGTCTVDRDIFANETTDDVKFGMIVSCVNEVFPWGEWSKCTATNMKTRSRYYQTKCGKYGQEEQVYPCLVCQPKVDIVFALDGSGSVKQANFDLLKAFVKMTINAFSVGDNATRFGLVQFSNDAVVEFDLNTSFECAEMMRLVDEMPYNRGFTYTNEVLDLVLTHTTLEANGNRPDAPDVLILLTDGASTNGSLTTTAADALHAANYSVLVIGIGDYNMAELEYIATGPSGEKLFVANTFDDLLSISVAFRSSLCKTGDVTWTGTSDYTEWTDWSTCSATCGGGVHTRTRSCLNAAVCGEEEQEDTKSCNEFCCWASKHDFHIDCSVSTTLQLYCPNDKYTRFIRVDDVLTCDGENCTSMTWIQNKIATRCDEQPDCKILYPCGMGSDLDTLHVLFECCFNPGQGGRIPAQNTPTGWPAHPHPLTPNSFKNSIFARRDHGPKPKRKGPNHLH